MIVEKYKDVFMQSPDDVPPRLKDVKPVIEVVPLPQEGEDFQYIRAVGLRLLGSGVLDARSRRVLDRLGLQHHRLGPTGTYQ